MNYTDATRKIAIHIKTLKNVDIYEEANKHGDTIHILFPNVPPECCRYDIATIVLDKDEELTTT